MLVSVICCCASSSWSITGCRGSDGADSPTARGAIISIAMAPAARDVVTVAAAAVDRRVNPTGDIDPSGG
ncbi:hypothetical protein MTER_22620 [Mycolicibacter terrae]|uniref:Uncharacterized protein n=1 Tax=Mycolicibacter terrae TaxID=1788 RepID=A0AAD1HY97_9MYCO|nr:hypothetical protein MTER_22620 [Mycolicibacter terrae]